MTNHKCFSRSGWWQTLCGCDAANQGFGWTTTTKDVGCTDCLKKIAAGEHRRWKTRHILMKDRRTSKEQKRPVGAPEEIRESTVMYLQVVVMPNGKVICDGKTIGWLKTLGQYLRSGFEV